MNNNKDKKCYINDHIGQYNNSVSIEQSSYADKDLYLKQGEIQKLFNDEVKILIVDDNAVNRLVARNLLTLLGVIVKEAASADDAINIIKKEAYDLILIDYLMPKMDGLELTRWIQEHFSEIIGPVIVGVLGNINDQIRQDFKQAGAYDVIKKPIEVDVLKQILRDIFPSYEMIPAEKIDIVQEESKYDRNERADIISRLISTIPEIDYDKGLHYATDDVFIYMKIIKVTAVNINQCINRMNKELQDISYFELKKEFHSIKTVLMHVGASSLASEASFMEEEINKGLTIDYTYIKKFVEKLINLLSALEHAIDAYTIIDSKENQKVKKECMKNKKSNKKEKEDRKNAVIYHAKRFEYELMLENLKDLLSLTDVNEEEKVEKMIFAAERFDYDGVIKLMDEVNDI